MDDITLSYWNKIYQEKIIPDEPSSFAVWVNNFCKNNSILFTTVLDLGCGNGRDSFYFAKESKVVLGVDSNLIAINNNLSKINSDNVDFKCLAVKDLNQLNPLKFDFIYSRFFLHAIAVDEYDLLIRSLRNMLNLDGVFCAEFRTANDPLYLNSKKNGQEIKNADHFRRFLDFQNVNNDLVNLGLIKLFSKEESGLSVFNNENPVLGRVIYKL